MPTAPERFITNPQNQGMEEDNDDVDSAIGSETRSRSVSIASSVLNYRYENGRRYHAYREGAYPLPNDEKEQNRLDLAHHVFRLVLGGQLYRAPIQNPQRILDIGTGTGIWAIEMYASTQHPGRPDPNIVRPGPTSSPAPRSSGPT